MRVSLNTNGSSPLDKLWSLVQRVDPIDSFETFLGELGHHADEFSLATREGFEKLKDWAGDWTGFGTGPDRGLVLFFKEAASLGDFQQILDAVPWTAVSQAAFRSIPSGPRDDRPGFAVPGATISWEGDACNPGEHFDNGTLGVFLREEDSGSVWILSANHVISRNGKCHTNTVKIPGWGCVSREIMAVRIHDYNGTDTGLNEADAAIGRWESDVMPETRIECLPTLVAEPILPDRAVGLVATKVGTPDNRTHGRIALVGKRIAVDMRPILPYRRAEFVNQILIEDLPDASHPTFSHCGDSGSLVVCENAVESRPLGLLIANDAAPEGNENGSARYSAVTPMAHVLKALQSATGKHLRILTE